MSNVSCSIHSLIVMVYSWVQGDDGFKVDDVVVGLQHPGPSCSEIRSKGKQCALTAWLPSRHYTMYYSIYNPQHPGSQARGASCRHATFDIKSSRASSRDSQETRSFQPTELRTRGYHLPRQPTVFWKMSPNSTGWDYFGPVPIAH